MSARGGLRRLGANPAGAAGMILVLFIVAIAAAAPLLPLPDPDLTALQARLLAAGSPGHPLGTDPLGRDLLARLVWGSRVSLAVGAAATLLAAAIGTLLGLVAGYYGRWLDGLLMRAVDVLMAFPYLLLALAIVAALGPGLQNAMAAIAVANVPFFARTVRGVVLGLRDRPFVVAARMAGAGDAGLLAGEILPNVLPVVVVMMTTTLGWMVLETAGLSFLGLGAQPPQADLGSMLGAGREYLPIVPRLTLAPGLVIVALVLGINLAGDALRDLLDPRRDPSAGRGRPAPAPSSAGRAADADGLLLHVENLSVELRQRGGSTRPVDGVSFGLAAGERLALVGESGSGKSLTALSLLGLLPAGGAVVQGRAELDGERLVGAPEARLRRLRGSRIAYVPQNPASLDPFYTVGEQLLETLRAHRPLPAADARRRAVELLGAVSLPDPERHLASYPHTLSGGMQQRVMLALALANDPDLIIADECTSALDVTVQAEVLRLLDELCRARRMALIFITHDLALADGLCDRVAVMYAGQVVEEAPTADLLRAPRHPYTRALLGAVPVLGEPQRPLTVLPGLPPAAGEQPAGCRFAPRCAHAAAICRQRPIALWALGAGRRARCVRVEELQP